MRALWKGEDVAALERVAPGEFERRLKNHNPVYYLAQQVFFSNMRGMSPERARKYLYAPLHRDRLAKEIVDYYFAAPEKISGLLILMMRGSYKSTFMHGVVPLWITLREWLLNKYHARIALLHQLEDKASANLMRLKSKALGDPWFKETWTEFASDSDFGTKTEFSWPVVPKVKFASEPSIIARGIGADLTGFHFDHIFFSDLVVAKHITSQQERTMTKRRHDATMYTVLSGKPWYDGTRYHARDLYGDMTTAEVEGEQLYKVFRVKAREDDGTLSLPHKYSDAVLERMRLKEVSRAGNDLLFHLQMQNDVRSSFQISADVSWVQYTTMKAIRRTGFRIITVDPAWKGTENAGEGDFASIQVWNIERRGGLLIYTLLDGVHRNDLTDEDGIGHIFRLMRRYDVLYVAPEERGGRAFRARLAREAPAIGLRIKVIDLATMQSGKDMRITGFLGMLQARRIYIARECNKELMDALLNQISDHPQLDHDDALDAAAYISDPSILELYGPVFGASGDEEDEIFADDDYSHYEPRTKFSAF